VLLPFVTTSQPFGAVGEEQAAARRRAADASRAIERRIVIFVASVSLSGE
jgi:hypothetical protein